MTNLSSLSPAYITDNATAVAADIASGKTAYVNGGKVTGTGVYSPAMMEFDGSTGYYDKTGITTSGNKTTVTARFKRATFTGGTQEGIVRIDGSTGYTRGQLFLSASDHSTADYQGKLQFSVKNSAGTIVCRLLSPNVIIDNLEHTVFASFDGDLGTAIFIIDGVDADDTGNASRTAPTTATLDTGAGSSLFAVGRLAVTYEFEGDIGFVGHREAYLTNWSDFMTASGSPKALDETTWTEWGAQPLLWNEHGEMTNNLGSAGAMTKNGTIVVGKGGN